MPRKKEQQIKNIELERRRARQKVISGLIERWLMVLLTVDNWYCHGNIVANFDGDAISLYYRPPRGWRQHMKGERYCPPSEASSDSHKDNPWRGFVPRDRHYLYGN